MLAAVSPDALEALHSTLHRLERRWLPPAAPDNSVWHAWDPLPVAMFLDGLAVAAPLAPGRRFLDLGCGIGTKLALMYAMGWEVAGVERDPDYARAAADLVPEARVEVRDILDLDAPLDADLVYMYRPAVAEDLEERVERHVVSLLRPGAVLFLPARTLPDVWGLRRAGAEVWVR